MGDELLVAQTGRPGGLDAAAWEELGCSHKVSKLHQVSPTTDVDRKFCTSVKVAGLLSKSVDLEDDQGDLEDDSPLASVCSPKATTSSSTDGFSMGVRKQSARPPKHVIKAHLKSKGSSRSFALSLQQARMAKEMNQSALAQAINVKSVVINQYEQGKAVPNGMIISKLNRVLGCKLPSATKGTPRR